MLLSDLIDNLQSKIPARNGVPGELQYRKVVLDAVIDFSVRCALEKIGHISIIAGVATYDLPADFVKIIRLYAAGALDHGVAITPGGLVPVSQIQEHYTIANKKITFFPAPGYNQVRTLRYAAGWALTGSADNEEYAEMGDLEAAIVLLKAQADVKTLQINAEGGGVLAYRIGDESFDKAGGIQAMIAERNAKAFDYQSACQSYNGAKTVYGEYQP